MQTLNTLIHDYDWKLISWAERYGKGVWVVVGPISNHLYQLQEIKDGSDIESLELGFYLENEGAWLPAVHAADVSRALAALEEKLVGVADAEEWRDAVYKAFEAIMVESDDRYGLRLAVEEKKQELMKPESK